MRTMLIFAFGFSLRRLCTMRPKGCRFIVRPSATASPKTAIIASTIGLTLCLGSAARRLTSSTSSLRFISVFTPAAAGAGFGVAGAFDVSGAGAGILGLAGAGFVEVLDGFALLPASAVTALGFVFVALRVAIITTRLFVFWKQHTEICVKNHLSVDLAVSGNVNCCRINSGGIYVKHLFVAAGLIVVLAAEPSFAGSLSDPVVEPSVIAEDATASSEQLEGTLAGLSVLLIILAAAGAF